MESGSPIKTWSISTPIALRCVGLVWFLVYNKHMSYLSLCVVRCESKHIQYRHICLKEIGLRNTTCSQYVINLSYSWGGGHLMKMRIHLYFDNEQSIHTNSKSWEKWFTQSNEPMLNTSECFFPSTKSHFARSAELETGKNKIPQS